MPEPAEKPRTSTRRASRAAKPAPEPAPQARIEMPGSDGFTPEHKGEVDLDHEDANFAAEQILGANPLVGFDRAELVDSFRRLVGMLALEPRVVIQEQLSLARELFAVLTGTSKV